jgi:hypothetical protein
MTNWEQWEFDEKTAKTPPKTQQTTV